MFKSKFDAWLNSYFYAPNQAQKIIAFLLLPLSFIYCLVVILKRLFSKKESFYLPIISLGNLTIGGSGKTPLTIALAGKFEKSCVILRGYKRQTKGLVIVSLWGQIKCNVKASGDEAMLLANELKNSLIIVSENRKNAITKAKSLGAKVIFLDDGFSKSNINKFDILIQPKYEPYFSFTLPSSAYREPKFMIKDADLVLQENVDFQRISTIKNKTENMILVTAIANPQRLKQHFNATSAQFFYPDHYDFKKDELMQLIKKYNATSLLVTKKDAVKLESFNLPLSIIELEINLNQEIYSKISNYKESFERK